MSLRWLASWKAPFFIGGIIGTILLLAGMNLMVGAHVTKSGENDVTKSPQTDGESGNTGEPGTGDHSIRDRYLYLDGPILIGLGSVSFVVGSIVGCAKYFRMHRRDKKRRAREIKDNTNVTGKLPGLDTNNEGHENDAFSIAIADPATDAVTFHGSNKIVIHTSDLEPLTVVNKKSTGSDQSISRNSSTPVPLLDPIQNKVLESDSSNSSPAMSSDKKIKPEWYLPDSSETDHLLYNYGYKDDMLQHSTRPESLSTLSSSRHSLTKNIKNHKREEQSSQMSPSPRILSPMDSSSQFLCPEDALKPLKDSGPKVPKDCSTSQVKEIPVSNTSKNSRTNLQASSKTDSFLCHGEKETISKRRHNSSPSGTLSDKPKHVRIMLSSSEDTVFEDNVFVNRPRSPVQPNRSPSTRSIASGASYNEREVRHSPVGFDWNTELSTSYCKECRRPTDFSRPVIYYDQEGSAKPRYNDSLPERRARFQKSYTNDYYELHKIHNIRQGYKRYPDQGQMFLEGTKEPRNYIRAMKSYPGDYTSFIPSGEQSFKRENKETYYNYPYRKVNVLQEKQFRARCQSDTTDSRDRLRGDHVYSEADVYNRSDKQSHQKSEVPLLTPLQRSATFTTQGKLMKQHASLYESPRPMPRSASINSKSMTSSNVAITGGNYAPQGTAVRLEHTRKR